MTVSSTTNRASYTTSNATTHSFAYGFKIFADADLTVIVRSTSGTETTKTLNTHYIITGAGSASGGTVLFKYNTGTSSDAHYSATDYRPGNGETVILLREQPMTQGFDLVPNDPFSASSFEDALDKLTFMIHAHDEELGRAIKLSKTNTMTSTEFTTSATDRASKILAFDSSGEISVAQELGTYRGNWAASTAYNARDIVKDTSTNNIFICTTSHTSSGSQPLTTNTDSGKWALLVDAASATTSQSAAATSATASANSATAAASSASTASGHKDTANTAATNAANSATAAASSATSAASSLSTFTGQYHGNASSDPSSGLDAGDLYFNTSDNVLMVYSGSAWQRTTPTSTEQTNINALAASAVITDMSMLATTDIIEDMSLLAVSTVIDDMALLAVSDVITDMGLLATSANVTAMGHLGTSANVTAMGHLGTSANVTAMGHLGTSANVANMATLGTADAVSDMNTLAAISSDITSLAGSLEKTFTVTVVNDSGNKFALAVGGVSLGNAPTIEMFRGNKYIFDQSDSSNSGHPLAFKDGSGNAFTTGVTVTGTAGSSGAKVEFEVPSTAPDSMRYYCTQHGNGMGNTITVSNSNISIVAANIDNVNSFANQYRIGSSDPTSSLDTGDLFYNTTSNQLKIYSGSAWVAGVLAGSGFAATSNNLSDLGNASTALSNLGGMPLAGGTFTGDVTVKTSDGAILKLQTSDTSVGDGDVIGAIEFAAPNESDGTDAIATAASIVAEADATFAADNNKTDLVIKLGKSEAATERGRFKHEGGLTITGYDTDANPDPALQLLRDSASPADGDFIGNIYFQGKNDADENVTYAAILAVTNDITDGTEDGKLIFRVADGGNQAWSGYANNLITLEPDSISFDASGGTTFGGHSISNVSTLRLTSTSDLSTSSTGHAFQIGSSSGLNLSIDNNEIMARNNGSTSPLSLNHDGGDVRVGGSSVKVAGKETIWIPAAAMYPESTNGCAALAQVELSNGPELKCLDFDPSSDEHAQFTVAFPKSWNEGTITFSAYFTVSGTNTGTVSWALSGVSLSDNGDINTSFGTAVAPTAKAHSGTSGDLNITAESGDITIAGSPAAEDLCFFRIMRDVSADDQSGDARLLGIKLFYTTDAANDA